MHHLGDGTQGGIARPVAVQVVEQLQVVHVDDGDAAVEYLARHIPLVVAAVQRAGEGVHLLRLGVPPGDDQRVAVHKVDADIVLPVAHTALPEAQAEALVLRLLREEAAEVVVGEVVHPRAALGDDAALASQRVTERVHGVPPAARQLRCDLGTADAELLPPPVVFTNKITDGQQSGNEAFPFHGDAPSFPCVNQNKSNYIIAPRRHIATVFHAKSHYPQGKRKAPQRYVPLRGVSVGELNAD